jgi:hypothetical protein
MCAPSASANRRTLNSRGARCGAVDKATVMCPLSALDSQRKRIRVPAFPTVRSSSHSAHTFHAALRTLRHAPPGTLFVTKQRTRSSRRDNRGSSQRRSWLCATSGPSSRRRKRSTLASARVSCDHARVTHTHAHTHTHTHTHTRARTHTRTHTHAHTHTHTHLMWQRIRTRAHLPSARMLHLCCC